MPDMSTLPTAALFAILVVGIILLIAAGDFLVRGAAALARKFGIPALIVGLTIVAFGTSAPELVVSVQAVLAGASEMAIGNVIGSNIANVLLVLGLPALIMAIPTDTPGVTRNAFIAVMAAVIMIVIISVHSPLMRIQGAILFAGIIAYLTWMFGLAKSGSDDPALKEIAEIDDMGGMPAKTWLSVTFILGGIIGLAIGGNMIVSSGTQIASVFGVSDEVVGLTLVAIGTSLPELATVIVAAWRRETEVAIGNVLGSNIFNIFAVLGAAALTGPVVIPADLLVFDVWVMLAASVALLALIITRKPVGRATGAIFFGGYILYIGAIARSMMQAGG